MPPELAKKPDVDDPNIDDPNLLKPEDDLEGGHKDDLPEISEAEERALKAGWKDKDEWEGDPDDWTSAKRFNQTRDIIESNKTLRAQQDRMQHSFDNRLDNLQKFHEQSLNTQITSLKKKRDDAASEADMDTYNQANEQLDEIQKTDVPRETKPINQQELMASIVSHPSTQTFINENVWIKDNQNPKGLYGQKVFTDWITANVNNPDAILEDGLKLVKESVNREFPQINHNRETGQSMGDRSTGSRRHASRNRLTLNDLTREEKNIYDTMGKTWKSDEDFLQAVADSRKGE